MVKSSRRRCKRQGVLTREKMSALRLIHKGVLNPMHLTQRLSVAFALRCIYRTLLRLRRIQTEANKAPIAEGQKLALLH